MSYPFLYKDQHHAQAIALFCTDFRFKDATLSYLKHELQLTDLDIIVLLGASKNLSAPSNQSDFDIVMRQIELSIKLHQTKKIILIDHADCGAYGGAAAFETSQEEREARVVNLRKAKEILTQKFPNKEIILIYANLKNQEVKFEKV